MKRIKLHNAAGGVHANGNATYVAAAAIKRGQPLKFDGDEKTPCTAVTDAADSVALDDADLGDIVPVAILGCYTGTVLLRAGGVIARGAQITALGTTTGNATDVIIGRAIDAAAAVGDLINIAHQVGQVL